MEADGQALLKVTAWVAVSMTYSRYASSTLEPGKLRLLALLPVLILLPTLPWYFSYINLRGPATFFLVWLAPFKLLLLSFDAGPLSPSLPLVTFIVTASLPVKLRSVKASTTTNLLLLPYALKAITLVFIIGLYRYKSNFHPYLLISIYCLHLYLALELVLSSTALLVGVLLGLEVEPQFVAPFKSSSLRDFWGRRWNLMVTSILRPSVFSPVRNRYGFAAAVMATFVVSGLMHEIMLYYITLATPNGQMSCFFILHGLCLLAEAKAGEYRWPKPRPLVATVMVVAFVGLTGFWLFFPALMRNSTDEKIVEEFVAVMRFFEDGGWSIPGRIRGRL